MPIDTNLHFPRDTRLWRVTGWAAIGVVGTISKIWLQWLNKFHCQNRSVLHSMLSRPCNVPLITVMNHTSCLDDPCLWGNLPLSYLVGLNNRRRMRWSLGATDICFTSNLHARFFLTGKTVPCVRGDGVYQRSMDYVLNKLDKGDWVHVFPEGKVNMYNEDIRLKWGVGRLISECKVNPIVIPMYHCGMQNILPNTPPYIPRIRQTVTMYVGEPMDFSQQLESLRQAKKTSVEIRKAITDVIQSELSSLKTKTEHLHNERLAGSKNS